MRVLFVSGTPYSPQRTGGAQSSTDQLIGLLRARGHACAVACALDGGGSLGLRSRIQMKLARRRFSRDAFNGYDVFRAWFPTEEAAAAAAAFGADVAVVQNHRTAPLVASLQASGVPVVVYFRNVEFAELHGDLRTLTPQPLYIANSDFTAAAYRSAFGVACQVIPPLVHADRYRTTTSAENVTFVNPVPHKGLKIALGVARLCPDIPFVFVESWFREPDEVRSLQVELASLPNVTLRPRTSDMKSVYGKARLVLAPSVWEEAWGRIASEAHVSGIPVVGSTRGGLPEAVGPGGRLLDVDAPIEVWAEAVRSLWFDPAAYRAASAAALEYSRRPDIDPERQITRFIDILDKARAQFAAAAPSS